ncbi:hypothetical protein FRC17_005628 [Serendipita sp. 399]|nr:hypothetical protein FRC17_005628 [Serendipita sp. 399]
MAEQIPKTSLTERRNGENALTLNEIKNLRSDNTPSHIHGPEATFVHPQMEAVKINDHIVERNAQAQTSKRTDPLQVLPTELWLHIMVDVIGPDSVNVLPLLLVSRHWWNVLLGTSSLWTNFYIRDIPSEDGDLTVELLPLSKDLPLSVTVEIPSAAMNRTHRIWEEIDRIRDLTFKRSPQRIRSQSPVDVGAMERFYDSVFLHLCYFKTLPSIETLTMDHAFDYYSLSMVEPRFPATPKLKAIHFWCLTTGSFSNISTENLEFLSASSPLETLYACLTPVKRLKRIVLTQAGQEASYVSSTSNIKSEELPLLEAVEFYQNSPLSMRFLLSVPDSHLREVHIKLDWGELQTLAPLFSNLPQLDHLHLIFKIPTSEMANYELPLPPLPRLRTLELEQQAIVPIVVEPGQKAGSAPAQAIFSSLFDACRTSATSVQNFLLVLHESIPTAGLLQLLEQMNRIVVLELKGTFAPVAKRVVVLPSIEDLSLSNQGLLALAEFPNVMQLVVATKGEAMDILPPLKAPRLRKLSLHSKLAPMLRQDMVPDLQNLTWIDPGGGCASVVRHLHSLTTLKFDHSSPRKECNDLCELILRYPYSCRSLKALEMRAYPEWDILFHMLLRRNFLGEQGIAPIATLKLPGYPGISLLEPLTELLDGIYPKHIPPIADLSLNAVDGPYFDVDVYGTPHSLEETVADPFPDLTSLGCEDCIDCRMNCDQPYERHDRSLYEMEKAKEIDMNVQDPTEVPPLEGSDPPLPAELQTWFDGWSIRRRSWYAKWQKFDFHSRRKGSCERHDYNELVIVTGSMLQGIPYESNEISLLHHQLEPPSMEQPSRDNRVEVDLVNSMRALVETEQIKGAVQLEGKSGSVS